MICSKFLHLIGFLYILFNNKDSIAAFSQEKSFMENRFLSLSISLIIVGTLFAQSQDSSAAQSPATNDTALVTTATKPSTPPGVNKITFFTTSQFDSLLSLLPNGDSIRRNTQVVGIGKEEQTGNLVLIVLNVNGDPLKLTSAAPAGQPVTQEAGKTKKIEQNGRTWFIIETSLKSLFTYAMAYGIVLDRGENTSGQVITGLSFLTVGGMLYGSFAFTKNMELGYGKVALMNYGSTALGNYYPQFLSLCLANATRLDEKRWYADTVYTSWGDIDNIISRPKITDYIRAGTSIIGFPTGVYLGSRLNITKKDEYGKVALMEYFSQTFAALSFALPVFYYDDPADKDNRHYLSASSGLAMCMIPAGFYGGYWLGKGKEISAGRGSLLWVTGTMGSLTGLGLAFLGDEYHGIASVRAILGSTIAGYAGGSWLGLKYHPQTDYTFWQTVFIGASAAAGTGVGVSFPLIAQANNRRAYILFAIAGGWTGFYFGERLSLQLFEKSSRDKKVSTIRLDLPGLATLPLLLTPSKTASTGHYGFSGAAALPMANLEWRF
jgi:hypothetical protein